MSIADYLHAHELPLHGDTISNADAIRLTSAISSDETFQAYVDVLRSFRLCGTPFALSDEQDLSGLGADLQWLTPDQTISEALEAYPGIIVTKKGYIPVGMCLRGSGDYYYINTKSPNPLDPPLVRIPHDGVTSNTTYAEDMIEPVSTSLTNFFRAATLEEPSA